MILGAALRVLMEGGTEAVNVKSLAAELGCSTQPIYLSFDNMDMPNYILMEICRCG